MDHKFKEDTEWFVRQIESRKRLLPTFAHVAGMLFKEVNKDFNKFIDEHAYDKVYDEDGELVEFGVPEDFSGRYNLIEKTRTHSAIFSDLLPKMALISLVSLFDAYLARLIRNMFSVKPDLLNSSEKSLKFSDLVEFDSLDDARDSVVGMEIESILRENHADQFKWLEEKIKIPLRELDAWKTFIEITERRNLFVHVDGIVNKQYLLVCKKHGCKIDSEVAKGSKISVPLEYYQEACDCIAEIGVKLGQVLWRKLVPTDLDNADNSLIEVTYDFLVSRDYGLALTLCRLCEIPVIKNSCLEHQYYLKLNQAIALKGLEKDNEMDSLLKSVDWSVLSEKFKLANLVLTEEWDEAKNVMVKIGPKGDFSKQCYRDWPLFRWFRKTDQFKSAYLEVFEEEYKIIGKTDVDSKSDEAPEADEDAKPNKSQSQSMGSDSIDLDVLA